LKLAVPPARLRASTTLFSNQVSPLDDSLLDATRSAFVTVEGLPGRVGVYNKSQLMAVRFLPAACLGAVRPNHGLDPEALVENLRQHLSALRRHKLPLRALSGGESFRWVHGDADGLPGLVVDDYGAMVVVQSGAHAGELLLPHVVRALEPLCGNRPLFERSSGQSRAMAGLPERTRALRGVVPDEVEASFAGLRLRFAPARAQKTGLFLDQSFNLALFGRLLRMANLPNEGEAPNEGAAPPWESLLDVCCYAGAWAATAAAAGLTRFTLIDQDAVALARAAENVVRNGSGAPPTVETLHGDMFERLSVLAREGRSFDVVVADPPAFAKTKKHVPEARRAYARLLKLSAKLVRPGGLLVACSCSRNMPEEEFVELAGGQLGAGPDGEGFDLVLRGSQAPDHTVPAGDALSLYLKCHFYRRRESRAGSGSAP
jgi:23S rRNA (cytosine1962-C5)-methyltransferase